MKVNASLKSYETLEFSITIHAPVSDWRAMVKLLNEMNKGSGRYAFAWPVGGLVGCIDKMLSDLDKTHADVLLVQDQALSTSNQTEPQ